MAGAYAHLTMVAELGSPKGLDGLGGLGRKEIGPLLSYTKYTELGAVSPDYPYLDIGSKASAGWADAMHYEHVGDRLKQGAAYIRTLKEEEKYKALAWLLGFTSHIVTDVSIHPVVELKTGPYAENPKAHRVCEMHQDVFIYHELKIGEIYSDAFIHDGVAACSDPAHPGRLDPLIVNVWTHMLHSADEERCRHSPPAFDRWHAGFRRMVHLAGEGRRFIPFARHTIAGQGLVYPATPDATYIRQLRVPGGACMDYTDIFKKAKANVRHYWALIALYCLTDAETDLSAIPNWNLDTGRDESGRITLWEQV